MNNDREAPFVAIIGGLWQLDPAQVEAAKSTAKHIGAELAKAGFGLAVYFSNDESLEPHVVAGYAEALTNHDATDVIRVRYAESQRGEVEFSEEEVRPELFDHRLFPGEDWEAPFYRSLAEEEGVDAVLLLAGAASTLIAGQIAIARRLPILAVDRFGGAATKIWKQQAQASPEDHHHSWEGRDSAAFVKQLKKECAEASEQRKEVYARELLLSAIASQRNQTVYGAGTFAFLVGSLFAGMVYTPYPAAYPMIVFAGLISAGATGALLRAILSGLVERHPRTSLLLGSVAGFVVGLAYLIPQWVGAPGVLSPTVDSVSATDKIQFASAVLVAVSAGVGFDTVFNRLQKQAQDAVIRPPG